MTRTLTSLLGNSQRLDGGAMFGNAPKALWSRWMAPDEQNRIPLACRALLVREDDPRTGDRREILLETGIGAFFDPKLKDRYGVVESEHVLLSSLERAGTSHERVDVVVLSHLHFDHAGGLLSPWREDAAPELLFPRASFVVGREAWERAKRPHARDRASFVPAVQELLEASGRLVIVDGPTTELLPGWRFHVSHGHTPGLLLAEVPMPDGPVVFAGDLVPGTPWVHLPITMGYDRHPELLVEEKERLLTDLVARGGRLFYTHDPEVAMSHVARDERGRFVPVEPTAALVDLAA